MIDCNEINYYDLVKTKFQVHTTFFSYEHLHPFKDFSNVLIVRKTCLPWNLLKNLFSKKASNSIKHKISSAKLSIFIYINNKLCIFSQSQKLVLQFLLNISEFQKLIPQKKTVF